MSTPTIQDVEAAAASLGTDIGAFDRKDQKAKSDRLAANASDAVATGSELDASSAKQAMIDSHTAFDAVLDAFLHPTTPPAPAP